MKLDILETDNRDVNTTTLVLSGGYEVDVDPAELFLNMVENSTEPGLVKQVRHLVSLLVADDLKEDCWRLVERLQRPSGLVA